MKRRFSKLHSAGAFHAHTVLSIRRILTYLAVLAGIVVLYSSIFQYLMVNVEGEHHTWVTAVYWTLMVMSTLGFGDVAFQSDIGRVFTMLVLTTGVLQLMVLLPFAFIRFSPWLERLMQIKPPTRVPEKVSDHIIITSYDDIMAPGVLRYARDEGIPCYLLHDDVDTAAAQFVDGRPVVVGDAEAIETYRAMRVAHARLVIINGQDTTSTNIILTIRELDTNVPIVAIANEEQSADILRVCGATHVISLKRWLGEQLANRVDALHARLNVIGQYETMKIAEVSLHRGPLVGRSIQEMQHQAAAGVHVVGVWNGSQLQRVASDFVLKEHHVIVVAGTETQLQGFEQWLEVSPRDSNPVLVIGGGRVGVAAAMRLRERDVPVHIVERNEALRTGLKMVCDRVFIGDAANYDVLHAAGIHAAPSAIITTNDDAMNIYLASYCRHLNSGIRIVSRITHKRNVEAIHRAGANLVLRFSSLALEAIKAILEHRDMLLLGENIRLHSIPVPPLLQDQLLSDSQIADRTGMIVLAIQLEDQEVISPESTSRLRQGAVVHLLGTEEQRARFDELFKSR